MPVADAFDQVVERTHAARGDHRHRHRVGNRARERNVEALPGAVTIHRGEQDLTRSERDHLARIGHGLEPGRLAPAVREYLPALALARLRHLLGVDRHHDALVAELFGRLLHERAPGHRRGIDRNLVGTGAQERADVVDGAHPAANRKRHETGLRGALDHIQDDGAILVAGRYIEKGQLIGTGRVIGDRGLDRVAGVPQIDEIDTFDDPPVLDVKAGDHANFEHRALPLPGIGRSAYMRIPR